jgi:hypothetical protein
MNTFSMHEIDCLIEGVSCYKQHKISQFHEMQKLRVICAAGRLWMDAASRPCDLTLVCDWF